MISLSRRSTRLLRTRRARGTCVVITNRLACSVAPRKNRSLDLYSHRIYTSIEMLPGSEGCSMAHMATQRPPFRADHVGSLLRPKELRDAFRRYGSGELVAPAFAQVQDKAIRDVVRLQEDAGLKVVTDGEFRRSSYWGRFVERCTGFAIKPAQFKFRDDHGHEAEFTATYATAKLARAQPLAADEFGFLRQVAKTTPKITMPAPSTMHFYRCGDFADPAVYADAGAFFE